MAEQFAFNQVLRNCSAVYLDEHFIAARTLPVDRTRDQFLSGSRFAEDQHASIGRRHELNLLSQRFHGDALAHNHAARRNLLSKIAILQPKFACLGGIFNQNQSFLYGQRLFQKIECTQLGCANGRFNRPVTRDDDHLGRIFEFADLLQGFEAI